MDINYDSIAESARQNSTEPKPANPLPLIAGAGAVGAAGYAGSRVPGMVNNAAANMSPIPGGPTAPAPSGGVASRVGPALGKLAAKQIPAMRLPMDVGEFINDVRGKGAAQSRTPPAAPEPAKAPMPRLKLVTPNKVAAEAPVSRHEVQYFSESQGKFVPIEEMPISHLRNAMNKLHAKLSATNQPSPVTRKQFEAIRDEVTFRAKQAGELTVPSPTKAGMGSAQSRVPAAQAPAAALEDQLAASIEAAQAARGIAATTAERQTIMNGLRGMAPPAIQALLMLLGTGDVEAQGNAAHELGTPPAIRKALAHQSQGS